MSTGGETARAILLRRSRFGDSSLIVSWITDSLGRIDTGARGALKPGGRFSGLLDLFRECEITVARPKRGDLWELREAALIRSHDDLGRSAPALQLAGYLCELVRLATEPEHPVPEIHELLSRALTYLETRDPSVRLLHRFERRLAGLLGIAGSSEPAERALVRHLHRLPSTRGPLIVSLS